MNLQSVIFFQEKESLDELQYMYVMGNDYHFIDGNLALYEAIFQYFLEPERIGTFLHYAFYDILQLGLHQNKIKMTTSLSKLMTSDLGKVDLTLITKFFAMNDFLNIDLLEDFELENSQVSLVNIKDCFNALKIEQSTNQFESFNGKRKDQSYVSLSPCWNLTEKSPCRSYCEWHKSVIENWSSVKIDILERYTYEIYLLL